MGDDVYEKGCRAVGLILIGLVPALYGAGMLLSATEAWDWVIGASFVLFALAAVSYAFDDWRQRRASAMSRLFYGLVAVVYGGGCSLLLLVDPQVPKFAGLFIVVTIPLLMSGLWTLFKVSRQLIRGY